MTGTRYGDRGRRNRSTDRARVWIVVLVLGLLEFYVRPSFAVGRGLPDFLLLALLIVSMRSRPGTAAIAGLAVGFIVDVLTPASFGAGMIAHVLVAWAVASGRAVFFADNLLVNAGFFFLGTWVRNVLLVAVSGTSMAELAAEATIWAPIQGISTTLAGLILVVLFRDWLVVKVLK